MDFQARLFILLKEYKNSIVKRQYMKKDCSIAFRGSILSCLKSLRKRQLLARKWIFFEIFCLYAQSHCAAEHSRALTPENFSCS